MNVYVLYTLKKSWWYISHWEWDSCALWRDQFSWIQSISRVRLFVTPWITARQASLSITNTPSLLKLVSIESVMPSSHLILCRPLLLLPPTPPSIRVFSSESTLHIRWPKYWSFSFSIYSSHNKLHIYKVYSKFWHIYKKSSSKSRLWTHLSPPMEKEMATHSSILTWKIPWTEESGRLQFMVPPTVEHDWVTSLTHSSPPKGPHASL